jgi:beta-ribofuranosylaminobenzene 5'-phosphate synthase
MPESPADDANADLIRREHTVRITTGSRLHFGLLDTAAPFGGIGVMIDQPITEVVLSPSDRFRCDDDSGPRVRSIAARVAELAGLSELPGCQIAVTGRAPQHSGLGSGTKLALATAEGLCRFLGIDVEPKFLASHLAVRGERSAVGVHGYFSGGLVFEAAEEGCQLNPLRQRVEMPRLWCVAIFQPTAGVTNVCGQFEREQFANLSTADEETVNALQQTITDQMLPAAQQKDFQTFTSIVQQYNRESGKLFASVQGGPYRGEAVANLVGSLIDLGARGVGQSSWGPGVFAWFSSRAEAEDFVRRVPEGCSLIAMAHPQNQPRELR